MKEEVKKLKQLIEASESIVITSHISPDPDAVCSSLLLAATLKQNYSEKNTHLVLEERPVRDLSFLNAYDTVEHGNLLEAASKYKPDLFIIIDANNFDRVSRNDGSELEKALKDIGCKIAVIDHHEPAGKADTDVYLNNSYPAATQDVYKTMFADFGLVKPAGYAEIALLGIISDTARFKFKNPKHRETFSVVSDLLDAGADIEVLENRLEQYTKEQMEVFAELSKNLTINDGFNYTFIADNFARSWIANDRAKEDFKAGCEIFVNNYIRNIAPNKWGFVVYQEMEQSHRNYAISFRSMSGIKDMSVIARSLGGGGHKPAAGVKFSADNVEQALKNVLSAVENTSDS